MKKLLKRLALILLVLFSASTITHAQSARTFYEQGIQAMRKSQWGYAISLFEKSIKLNDNAANKQKCNAKITVCRRNLSNAQRINKETDAVAKPTLDIDNTNINFSHKAEFAEVQVTATPKNGEWKTRIEPADATWLHTEKAEGGTKLHISCDSTSQPEPREAIVEFSYAGLTDTISVLQNGFVTITVDVVDEQNVYEITEGNIWKKGWKKFKDGFDAKLSDKSFLFIPITSNATTTYPDGRNWKVKELPSWCEEMTLTSITSSEKNTFVSFMTEYLNEKGLPIAIMGEQDLFKYALILYVEKLPKPRKKYGREGKITIESADTEYTFILLQPKKTTTYQGYNAFKR